MWVYLFHAYISQKILQIVSESTLIHASVCPNISTIPVFLVTIVTTDVNISVIFGWFPATLALSHSLMELTLVAWTVSPHVLALSVEFSSIVLSFIFVSVNKHLNTETLFDWLHKSTIIVLFLWQFEETVTIFLAISPITTVHYLSGCIQVDSSTIFNSLNPLTVVKIACHCF